MLGYRGFVFALAVKGPGTWAAWLVWGSGICFVGWALVGIPLVAAGDRICRLRPAVLAIAVGLCGVLIVSLPGLPAVLAHDFRAQGDIVIRPDPTFFKLEGSAFTIAAAAALLYRRLLATSSRGASPQADER